MTDQTTLKATPAAAVLPSGTASATAPPPVADPPSKRRPLVVSLLAVLIVMIGLYFYVPGLWLVTTDDAYVNAHVVTIVPKVAAYVSKLHINDNSKVRNGELMLELDPRDFLVAVDIANADLKSAQANVANIEAQLKEQTAVVSESEASVQGDQATLDYAQQQLERYKSLATSGSGTVQALQQSESVAGQANAALQRDGAALEAARAHRAVLDTQLQIARTATERQQATLTQAKLNLSYAKISASDVGSVADKKVEVGNYVQPGQVLFSIVPEALYVTANFKETQLTNVRPGQRATVRVDAFPTLRLQGHVDSIQRGTGSQFALLPPENATGNFVKVVQRIPVKITFDEPGEALRWISPGMSAEAKIITEEPPHWLSFIE